MTTVCVRRGERGVSGFTVSGHAGFALSGSDIVCAAVSVLVSTCVNAMETVAGVRPVVGRDGQTATIAVDLPPQISFERERDARIILRTAMQGFSDLAEQYPHNVQIK